MKVRDTRDGPFCWQNKEMLRWIRRRLSRSRHAERAANALLCYFALTELASDNGGKEPFEAAHDDVVALTHLSWRTVQRCLEALEEIQAIERARDERTAVYAYSLRGNATCHNGISRHATALVSDQDGVAPIKKKEEKKLEKKGGEESRIAVAAPDCSTRNTGQGGGKNGSPLSLKGSAKVGTGSPRPVDQITAQQAVKRIEARMKEIKDSYDEHRWPEGMTAEDRSEWGELIQEKRTQWPLTGWKKLSRSPGR